MFPFLALGLVVPLSARPRRDAEGALTLLAWAGCLVYAAYYPVLRLHLTPDTVPEWLYNTIG